MTSYATRCGRSPTTSRTPTTISPRNATAENHNRQMLVSFGFGIVTAVTTILAIVITVINGAG